jgi:hypothetical protein
MTTGVLLARDIYPTSSGYNPVLDHKIAVAQPYLARADASIAVGTRSGVLLSAPAFSLTGSRPATSFEMADWYFRIHVLPSLLSLGNVVSADVFTVGVWNAWLATAQTLNTIAAVSADGITLSGQPNPPLVFSANQQRNYTVTVSTSGPPTIDATYTFTFADAEAVSMTILGQRVTAWALTPDWSSPVMEKLAWLTDRKRAWSGVEQRRALRIAPRRNVAFSTWMTRADKQFVENQLFAWGALVWALPIWWDGQYLTVQSNPGDVLIVADTVDRDFVAGGLAIILTDARTYEVVQISTMTTSQLNLARAVLGTWPTGAKLYPVRAAQLLATTRLGRVEMNTAEVQPNFQIVEPCDWPPATGLPAYRGAPVLEDSPDVADTAEGGTGRDTYLIDSQTGALTVIDTALIGFPTNSHNWYLKGKTAQNAFRSLLYLLKGQQGEIWVPSYQADLTLVQDVASSDVNLHCNNSGVGLFAAVQNRRDIRIELSSGTIYYRRVTGAVQDTPTTELVSIDTAIGVNVAASTVRRISYMALSTLAADEITIEHVTQLRGLAVASTPFRAVDDNL